MNREQTQYLATFYNNLSIGVFIVGGITPILTTRKFDIITVVDVLASLISGIILFRAGLKKLEGVNDGSK